MEVSDKLLRALKDRRIIRRCHVETIENAVSESKKVDRLLRILERCDDMLLPAFGNILEAHGQAFVADRIWPQWKDWAIGRAKNINDDASVEMKDELKEIIDPDDGLPSEMHRIKFITGEQLEIIRDAKSAHRRVSCLLEAMEQNQTCVNDDKFLRVLKSNCQTHVVNFIKANGIIANIRGNDRPLNAQQRRQLYQRRLCEDFDSRNVDLQSFMLHKCVISRQQMTFVTSGISREQCNSRLLRVLSRRSVDDVKRFIIFHHMTGQMNVVEQLMKVGAVALITTSVCHSTMSDEERLRKEQLVAEYFDRPDASKMFLEIGERLRDMGQGAELTFVELTQSLSWYFTCRTVQSLDKLRSFYESSRCQLMKIFDTVFRRLCDGDNLCDNDNRDPLQLNVEWTNEDYQSCKKAFLSHSAGQPFGATVNYDGEHSVKQHSDTVRQRTALCRTVPYVIRIAVRCRQSTCKCMLMPANSGL